MREFTIEAFDENIGGPGTWYSSAQHNDLLGTADELILHARPSIVLGTPTLTVACEHSCNGLDWLPVGYGFFPGPEVTTGTNPLINEQVLTGKRAWFQPPMLTYVRLKVTVGSMGTNPGSCRLKVLATGRASVTSVPEHGGLERH